MKICLVAPELLPVPPIRGGALETWVESVAPELARLGAEVHVLSVSNPMLQPQTKRIGNGSVTYHYIVIPAILQRYPLTVLLRGYDYYRRVGALVRRLQPDIVQHLNRPLGLLVTQRRAGGRSRHLLSLQNIAYGWCFLGKELDRLWFRQGFAACDRVLAVSDFVRAHVRTRVPSYDPSRLFTLHNGVDTDAFIPNGQADHRTALGLSKDPVILFTGRIDPRKGVHVLLEVFRRVQRQIPSAQLVIIGPKGSYWDQRATPYARQMEQEISQLSNVHLTGPVYDRARLAQLYAMADVACLPFVSPEGFGLTSIEMQSCGVPTVTMASGGVPETVRNGQTGFVVAPHDINAMTEQVLLLLRDAALRRQMGQAARQFMEERFAWPVIARQLLHHYTEVLALTCANR